MKAYRMKIVTGGSDTKIDDKKKQKKSNENCQLKKIKLH